MIFKKTNKQTKINRYREREKKNYTCIYRNIKVCIDCKISNCEKKYFITIKNIYLKCPLIN